MPFGARFLRARVLLGRRDMSDIELESRLAEIRDLLSGVADSLNSLSLRETVVESRVTSAEKIQKIMLAEVRRLAARK